jgi:hypothetical protein
MAGAQEKAARSPLEPYDRAGAPASVRIVVPVTTGAVSCGFDRTDRTNQAPSSGKWKLPLAGRNGICDTSGTVRIDGG